MTLPRSQWQWPSGGHVSSAGLYAASLSASAGAGWLIGDWIGAILGSLLALLWTRGIRVGHRWLVLAGGDKPSTDPLLVSVIVATWSLAGGVTLVAPTDAAPVSGHVSRVVDGDTLDVQGIGRIRIHGIDAPEKNQPYGQAAAECLARLVASRSVTVTPVTRDVYGRTVARIAAGEIDVGRSLVSLGCAWARDQSYAAEQARAAAAGAGLWSLPPSERVPPWEWRKVH